MPVLFKSIVIKNNLMQDYAKFGVAKFELKDASNLGLEDVVNVTRVVSSHVCSMVCLEQSEKKTGEAEINSWLYGGDGEVVTDAKIRVQTCRCTRLPHHSSCRDLFGNQIFQPLLDESNETDTDTIYIKERDFAIQHDCAGTFSKISFLSFVHLFLKIGSLWQPENHCQSLPKQRC